MLGLRVPEPDEVMLVSGKRNVNGAPSKVLFSRAFVLPVLNRVRFLTLEQQQHQIQEDCFTKEKIPVRIVATIAFKVPAEEEACINAGQRFLSDQKLMPVAVGNITAGALRGIVGEMTLEGIISERTTLQEKVLDHAKSELAPQGLQIDTLNISQIQDLSPGESAIEALSTPHLAEIRRNAKIAQARADQEAAVAEQESQRQQADAARQTAVTTAGYNAEINTAQAESDQKTQVARASASAQIGSAQAEADQAGPLATAKSQREVVAAQTELAQRQADLREQQLVAEVVKPAEAEAERTKLAAAAEAEATRVKADAIASSNRVALDQLVIEKLPEVAQALAGGLSSANITILNGADGLSELTAGLVKQVMSVYDTARSLRTTNGASPNGGVKEQTRDTAHLPR